MSDLERRQWAVLFAEIGLFRIAEEAPDSRNRSIFMVKIRENLMHINARLNRLIRMDP